jgi:hypothetical protein
LQPALLRRRTPLGGKVVVLVELVEEFVEEFVDVFVEPDKTRGAIGTEGSIPDLPFNVTLIEPWTGELPWHETSIVPEEPLPVIQTGNGKFWIELSFKVIVTGEM